MSNIKNDISINISTSKIREDLERRLILNKSNMWSYTENLEDRHLSDKIIILKYLNDGSPEDLEKLVLVFPINVIHNYWLRGMVYGELNESRQIELATNLFGIKNPNEYLKNERAKRLEVRTQRCSI